MKLPKPNSGQVTVNGDSMYGQAVSINELKSSLGGTETWPAVLRSTVDTILHARLPMLLWWGPEFVEIFNDAFSKVRSPHSLGQKAAQSWKQNWQELKPILDTILKGGNSGLPEGVPFSFSLPGNSDLSYWNVSLSPVRDENGAAVGILALFIEGGTKSQKLFRSEEGWRAVTVTNKEDATVQLDGEAVTVEYDTSLALDAAELGHWSLIPSTNRLSCSQRARLLFGLPENREAYLGQAIDAIHHEDRHRVVVAIQKALSYESGGRYCIEYRVVHPLNGHCTAVEAIGRAYFNEEQNPYRFTGIVRDITERNRADQTLPHRQGRLPSALESARMGTWDHNILTGEITASDGLRAHFGVPDDGEFSYETLIGCVVEEDRARVHRVHREVMELKDGRSEYEIVFGIRRIEDGQPRWLKSTGKVYAGRTGTPFWFTGTTRDVTLEKTTEQELVYRKALLEAQNESIPDAVLVVDTKGAMLSYNRHFVDMWHIPQEIIEANDDDAALRVAMDQVADAQGFIDRVSHCYAHPDEAAHDEVQFKDGRTIERYGNSVRGDNGTSYGWIWYFRDITQRKRAETALRDSESRFQNLIREAPVGIALFTGPEMKVEIVNKAFGLLIERTPEELLGRDLFSVIPDAEDMYLPLMEGVRLSGEPLYLYDSPYRVMKDDRPIEGFVNVVYQPYNDTEGRVSGVLVLCQDVTGSVKAKKALEESEDRFRTLAETLPQMIWVRGMDGSIEYASQSWEEYTGIKDLRAAWRTMTHPDDWGPVMDVWQKAMDAGLPFEHEVRLKNREGEYRWQYAVGEPVRDEEGKVVKYIGALTDIHAQKTFSERLEEQVAQRTSDMQKAQSLLQQVIDSSVEYISVVDKGLNIVTVNKRIEDKWNVDRELLKGRYLFDFEPKVNGTEQHRSILKALGGETVHLEKRATITRPDTFVDTYFFPLFTGGKVEGVIIMARDVTAIVQSEKKLEQTNLELQRSNGDLQQFAHVASHDLKEPVRKILIFCSLLTREFENMPEEKSRLYLSKIESAALRMHAMIDGVLLYSSLNALEQSSGGVELNKVIENVVSDLEMVIARKEANVRYGGLPRVEGSEVLMHQLFYNLINNSLKFSSPNRKPEIRLSYAAASKDEIGSNGLNPEREYVRITLQDNGIGFSNEMAERIFGTFTRLHSKDRYEGTGLGLALCKKIAERHGGVIHARGNEGEGASFTLLLPK